ncbi:TonB-linked SusC/RagA family outer membrane protein [Chitinophaga dinghuensis]|uniref:TonB-linked SusC/RagA family outer membrane protein n=1 Tax=Chitinophaga dinghuensis TaxID=1539050 RepID=A0A327W209_9BACT|nr:TonB-dependent receptor [Chitinophaga dinghuensis]RAJ82064.1 TonB-linked SusC/RagA family outer membrane protein [Chitinophaga dinghuensis]
MQPSLRHHLKHPKRVKPVLMLLLAAIPFTESFSAFSQALQNVVPGMEVKNGTLTQAIASLEKKAGVRISYDQRALSTVHVAPHSWKNETVAAILSDLLSSTGLKYEERQQTIVIFSANQAGADNSLQQEKKITGTVTDANGPLPGAVVLVKGTSKGAITDASGRFAINASADGEVILTVSMVGYKTAEVAYNGAPLQVVMTTNSRELGQVLVVGYGSQSRTKISSAITDVKLDKLNSRSVNSVEEAMQGKAPGVVVQNQGGDPTSPPKVYIRGTGGINGENPLYVVDGSIYNGLINPADIETITVLKDAAAAIYGARASGGVILITTKKGKSGRMSVNADAKFGVQQVYKTLKVLDAAEFNNVMNQAYDNAGVTRNPAYDPTQNPDGNVTRTDWMKAITRRAQLQEYNVDLNGGNDKSRYFMGFGYRKQEGILLNTFNERYNFRLNTDHQVTPWLKIGENLSYAYSNGNGANTTSAYTGAILTALYYTPSVTPYQPDGSFSGLPVKFAGAYGDVINPVAYLQRLDSKNPKSYLLINPYVEVKLPANLTFKSNLAINKVFDNTKSFTSRVLEIGKIFDFNNLYLSNSNTNDVLAEQTLTYDKQLHDHHFNAIGGYSYQQIQRDYFSLLVNNFNDERPAFRYPQNGAAVDPLGFLGGRDKQAIESFFARLNYDYKAKYLLSVVGRRDGSSLVAPQNRYQNYYSVSAGWVLSNEGFMKDIVAGKTLSYLKLRASNGLLGNLGSLPVGAVNPLLDKKTSYFGVTPTVSNGYAETALANPNLTWAESKQTNIGLDLGLLDNRIYLVADYYIKNTIKMLRQKPPLSTDGVPNGTWMNVGDVRDNGIELGITFNSKQGSEFQYSVSANLATVNNKLLSLGLGDQVLNTSNINIRSSITPIRIQEGQPLYSYYLVKTAGIFQSQKEIDDYTWTDPKTGTVNKIQPNAKPGDLKFIDANNDGKINNSDRQFMGTPFPKFTYGFSFNGSYKGFDINIFLQGVQGNKIFNALKYTGLAPMVTSQGYNLLADVKNAWTPTNTNTNIPRVSISDPNGNFGTTSDWYLENGSYMRIKNITLGYTLPDKLTERYHINKLRVFVTGNNLFTFTKYSGMDPEVGTDTYGIDLGRYPQARGFIAGLNLNF